MVAPGLLAAELPHHDAVLISHNHYDHLDVESVRALARQLGGPPRFYVPLGLAAWFKDKGIDGAIELDWWQTNLLAAAQIQLVPVQHWSKRSLTDTNETLWGGWVIKHAGLTALFCGDTGYSKDFKDIAAKLGTIDLAFIPIGAYEPRWFMQPYHIDPAEAVQIQRELGAHNAVGMHWGTFGKLTDEPMNAPPQALNAALDANRMPRDRFFAMQHGETRVLHGSGPTASWVARTAAAPLPQLKSGGEKPSATLTVGLASR